MTPLQIGPIRCVVDIEATRRIYSQLVSGGAERCGCLYCRNFVETREFMFPRALQSALESAGIDWRKESEAVHYGRVNDSGHLYDVWLNFVGSVENGSPFDMASEYGAGLTIQISGYNDADRYTPKQPVFDNQVVGRIEIRGTLPWVLTADPEMDSPG